MQVRTPPPNTPPLRSWELHMVSASPLPGPSLVVPMDVRNPGCIWKIPSSFLLPSVSAVDELLALSVWPGSN